MITLPSGPIEELFAVSAFLEGGVSSHEATFHYGRAEKTNKEKNLKKAEVKLNKNQTALIITVGTGSTVEDSNMSRTPLILIEIGTAVISGVGICPAPSISN